MRRLRRFSRLSRIEKWLLIKAILLLSVIGLGLWLLPFEVVRRFLIGMRRTPARANSEEQVIRERVVWAVETAGRCVPLAATCFTKAIATQMLLARQGHSTRLHIGVAKDQEGEFSAHAWLESDGKVLVGDYQLERYTTMLELET